MEKRNRFLSFELLFALLFIVAFFLPWLDYGPLKTIGWKIPGLNEDITRATNFVKFFSKNKESVYTGYVLHLIPILSAIIIVLCLFLKQKAARVLLLLTGIIGFILSIYMFYKLPGVGNGVYLLSGSTALSVVYTFFALRKKKADKEIANTDTTEVSE